MNFDGLKKIVSNLHFVAKSGNNNIEQHVISIHASNTQILLSARNHNSLAAKSISLQLCDSMLLCLSFYTFWLYRDEGIFSLEIMLILYIGCLNREYKCLRMCVFS